MNSLLGKLALTACAPVLLIVYVVGSTVISFYDSLQAIHKDLVFIWTGRY